MTEAECEKESEKEILLHRFAYTLCLTEKKNRLIAAAATIAKQKCMRPAMDWRHVCLSIRDSHRAEKRTRNENTTERTQQKREEEKKKITMLKKIKIYCIREMVEERKKNKKKKQKTRRNQPN